jgi:hypothetical protein
VSLCFNWAPCHEGILRGGDIAPRILDLSTRWRWVVSFMPQLLYPRERTPGTNWIGGWVGPKAGLDMVVKRKIPSLTGTHTLNHPACSPALYHWAMCLNKTIVNWDFMVFQQCKFKSWSSGLWWKMQAVWPSKMMIPYHITAWYHNPDDCNMSL